MDFFHYLRRFRRRTCAWHTMPRSRQFIRRIALELLEERTVLSANVFTVNSTVDFDSDPTKTTLREAITAANATVNLTEPDLIQFNIPANDAGHAYYHNDGLSGQVSISQITVTAASDDALLSDPDPDWPHSWFTIRLMATPPPITEAVVIDGYTQPGASANTLAIGSDAVLRIELDGSLPSNASGLEVGGNGNTIRGLAINRFRGSLVQNTGFGIYLNLGDNNIVEGNRLGTDVAGKLDLGNATDGVYLRGSSNNRIGGTTPGARNVISGNNNNGIDFFLSSASNNLVQGNYIGINAAGRAALGNGNGVSIGGGVSSITIGGTAPGAGNVISGNAFDGIVMAGFGGSHLIQGNLIGTDPNGTSDLGNAHNGVNLEQGNTTIGGNVISGNNENGVKLSGAAATGNLVQGNYIGTNATGAGAVGNNGAGVAVASGATSNTIGGATSGAGNVLSGNGSGVAIQQSPANRVQGNRIGTQADGSSPLGNTYYGVSITDANDNLIGGTDAGNTIAFSGLDGVNVFFAQAGAGNAILGNRIFSNDGLGIDLSPDNVTPNDVGDGDTGANNRQNFPVLTSVQTTKSTTIAGTLNSTPNTTFRIEFFANTAADASGFGEGQTFLGAVDVLTNTSGDAAFAPTFSATVGASQFITATATVLTGGSSNPGFGDTSEFSQYIEVPLLQEFDFGDAPNWFPTLLAQDGARHIIDPFVRLLLVDAEDDGQPGLLADADDAADSDDEDGVRLETLVAGHFADVMVIASAAGVLNGWIDFDVDGGWSDPGEQIFIDQAVHGGLNRLAFAVPAWAVTPGTYARFRYSSASGLSYVGEAPDGEVEDYLVPIFEPSTVSGLKFSDLNGDRDRDANEPGLDGWFIYADLDDNGTHSADEPAAVTANGGLYTLEGIPPGTYKIREVPKPNWVQTFPDFGYYELNFDPGSSVEGATFGNRPLMDFGDANGYPTLFAQGGAAHIIDPDFYLGFRIDDEADGQPAGVASGDDAGGDDDEDGVFFVQQLLAGNEAQINVVASAAGFLDAWLDFNGDSDWDDAGEQIFDSRELADGFNALSIRVPDFVVSRQTFARFRLSSAGGLSPRGLADDGEVEDYLVTILRHEDFGDAPPAYASTLLADNGARHLIVDGFYLGPALTTIDSETDGQPSASADGDDNDGDDDENGVFFPNPMQPGQELSIVVSASAGGRLDAWFDFNADGDWADFGEQVFAGEALVPGVNFRRIDVPVGAALSDVFARFRFSSAGGLSYDGPADDGEVEDHAVPIDAVGTLAGRVWHDRDMDGQQATDEPGLGGWGVFLDDDNDGVLDSNERSTATDAGGNYAFENLAPGVYDVGQVGQPGWQQAFPPWIPSWVYVAQQVWRPRDLSNPGYFVANRVQIFDQSTLELLDTFAHAELDEGLIYDIEIGLGGDVYVAVDLGQGQGQIVQFTYEGEYLRTIDLPDDGEAFHTYPNGFDVLPDGSLLIPQPDNERIVRLNPDSSVDVMLDLPGLCPRDAAVLSDGTIVFTTDDPDADPRDALLNVRSDDLLWVGTSEGAQLRKWGGGVIRTRGDVPVREALETSEGILFTTEAIPGPPVIFPTSEHRLVTYDADGNELAHATLVGPDVFEGDVLPIPVETEVVALGLAVALSEVPFGEPVRGGAGALAVNQAVLGVQLVQTEIPVPPNPNVVATGRGSWSVRVEAGQVTQGVDFGVVQLSTASGVKFNDLDGDRTHDADEPGLDGWVIYADLDGDGIRDGLEPFATTAGGGFYTIAGIPPGTYPIREVPQQPWTQTAPEGGYYERLFVSGSSLTDLDFGNRLNNADFGDAPASYSTLWADDGAWHAIDSTLRLGDLIDAESDGQPHETAEGDDLVGVSDEDGVVLRRLVAGHRTDPLVTASRQALLSAWVDWNQDGDWADAGEQVLADAPVHSGLQFVDFAIPDTALAGPTFARFRLSSQAGLSFHGPAPDGEVEDYQVLVERPVGIYGSTWNDLDADSTWDEGEPALAGWTIYLSQINDGEGGDGPISATTDENGRYGFTDLAPGTYIVREDAPENWEPTSPHHMLRRISVDRFGNQANGGSSAPAIGGGSVAFQSAASNLVPHDGADIEIFGFGGRGDIECVSVDSEGGYCNESFNPSVYGRYFVAESRSVNIVPGDHNGAQDIFYFNPFSFGPTYAERVSIGNSLEEANGDSSHPSIGGGLTGRFVAFDSVATNLLGRDELGFPIDSNGVSDVFVYDRDVPYLNGITVRNHGRQGNLPSFQPSISNDGWSVAFTSLASNLVPGDTNGTFDIFVADTLGVQIERVSVGRRGNQEIEANGDSQSASISADGRFVAFASSADNLVPGDTNGVIDIFVFDRQTRMIERVSVGRQGDGEIQTDGHSFSPSISPDGRFIAFESQAANLSPEGDTNGETDIFLFDRHTRTIERVSVDAAGRQSNDTSLHAAIGFDGRRIAFASFATNLVPGDTNVVSDVFVYEKYAHSVLLNSGQVAEGLDFGNVYYSNSIAGVKYDDLDQDGMRDPGEPGLDRWIVYIDLDDDGAHDESEPFDITHDGGQFAIAANVPAGSHKLREVPQPGWTSTEPPAGFYELDFGPESRFSGMLFGNRVVLDYGDAPDPFYPTLVANNGASHKIRPGFFLGSRVDDEPDGQPGAFANGDDTGGFDDEDGVEFLTPLLLGQDASIRVTASAPGNLDAWIDFNADGDWQDAGEQIFAHQPLVAGPQLLDVSVPSDAKDSYARFRFSTLGGLPFDGPAEDGEVEDYPVTIASPCPGDQVFVDGDVLHLLGDLNDNRFQVAVDPAGRFIVNQMACSSAFTGIRRIVAELEAGDDQLSLFAPVTAMFAPIEVEVHTDEGNDQVLFENWHGNVMVDLGAGDDTADVRQIGGSPDPSNRQLSIAAGQGDDIVEVKNDSFFDIFVDLGAGDDQAMFEQQTDVTGPIDPEDRQLRVVGGQGDDVVQIADFQQPAVHWTAVSIDLGDGDDHGLVELGRQPGAALPQRYQITAGAGDDEVRFMVDEARGLDFGLTIDLGVGNDHGVVEVSPQDDFPLPIAVRVAAGAGDDDVEVMACSFFDLNFDVNLGDGADTARVNFEIDGPIPPDPLEMKYMVAAGSGDDDVSIFLDTLPLAAMANFAVDLGAGNDMASLMWLNDPETFSIGPETRSLQFIVAAGAGDDLVEVEGPSAFDVILNLNLGAGNDTAKLNFPIDGGLGPDTLQLNVVADAGDDRLEIVAITMTDVSGEIDLGAGDDTAILDLRAGVGPSCLDVDLATGAGDDNVNLLADSFFDVFVDLDLSEDNNAANIVIQKVRESTISVHSLNGADAINVQIDTDIDPTADGSVRFLADTGGGNDVVSAIAASFFDVFTELDLGADNDTAMLDLRAGVGLSCLELSLAAGAGDDEVNLTADSFFDVFVDVDLGDGNNTLNVLLQKVRESETETDPTADGSVRFLTTAGGGNDVVNVMADSFFDVFANIHLGAGDDQTAFTGILDAQPPGTAIPMWEVHIDAGSGIDGVVCDVEHIALTEVLESIFITGVGLLAILELFPLGALSMAQAVRDGRIAGQSEVSLTWDGSDAAIDVRTGATDDLIKLELDPAADGSVRFAAATGDGGDEVQITAPSFFDVFADLNLGAGNDKASVKQSLGLPPAETQPGPRQTKVMIAAGTGNDEVNLQVDAFFDVFVDLDLGAGNDRATLRYVGGNRIDPTGKVRELRVKMQGGWGNDTLQADVNALLADLVFMDFDGGLGNDLIRVDYRDSSATGLPPQNLHIHVLGGDGNDDLALFVATSRLKRLLDLLLDGGKGRDRGSATPNVKVKNREIVVPAPAQAVQSSIRPVSAASRAVSGRSKK